MASISKEEMEARSDPSSVKNVEFWEGKLEEKVSEAQQRGLQTQTGTKGDEGVDTKESRKTSRKEIGERYGVDLDKMESDFERAGEPNKGAKD